MPDENPDLRTQVPGEVPGVDPENLAQLLDMNVPDLVEGLDALTDDELVVLRDLEQQGKNRSSAIAAIDAEQKRRALDEPKDDAPVEGPAPIGDDHSYAGMHAHQVDQAKITRPVLTLDGWVLPLPAAKAE